MSDRELLELAAKAAGMRYYYASYQKHLHIEHQHMADGIHWNPLTDDGDALRLAVKLRLTVFEASVLTPDGDAVNVFPGEAPDRYAATRRAIVRAAAEIGRNMK